MSTFITYKIVGDHAGRLKAAARLGCNFWNHYVEPEHPVVIDMNVFESDDEVLAYAAWPELKDGALRSCIQFNTKYLTAGSELRTAATVTHEIGHTLGFGSERWRKLFNGLTGHFKKKAKEDLPALAEMRVERWHGAGTRHVHWAEKQHGGELMTGLENATEHVLPVTIDIMPLLGHTVRRRLETKTDFADLLARLQNAPFDRKEDAKVLTAVDFVPTHLWERVLYNVSKAKQHLAQVPKATKALKSKRG